MHDAVIVAFFWPDVYLHKVLQYISAETFLPSVATAMIWPQVKEIRALGKWNWKQTYNPVRYHAKLLHWEKL